MCKQTVKHAKSIIARGIQEPFYKIKAYETDKGVSLFFQDDKGDCVFLNYSGLYCIYRKLNDKLECLYVGKTDHTIYGRINRWAKGIAGKLRPDESHSAATKARKDGVTLNDELLIKTIDSNTINSLIDNDPLYMYYIHLDEWIAPLLKSKYNTIVYEVENNLEDFFEEQGV